MVFSYRDFLEFMLLSGEDCIWIVTSVTNDPVFRAELRQFFDVVVCFLIFLFVTLVQEAPLHQELHPPQPLHLLHPESRGRAGEGWHHLQPDIAVLQPAISGEKVPHPGNDRCRAGSCTVWMRKRVCLSMTQTGQNRLRKYIHDDFKNTF